MAATEKNEAMIERAKGLNNVPWCEQYERMISGMLYEAGAPDLEASRFKARAWCHKYNNWFPHNNPNGSMHLLEEERLKQLKEIVGKVGKTAFIEPPFRIDYGCNIILGDGVYANFNLTILDCALVTIGDRVMFGPNVSILAATHETDVQSRLNGVEYAKEIVIEADCWIGGHAVILPGVTIGEGCTIAAGSIVTRSIEPWSVAMGQPARIVKKVKPLDKVDTRETNFSASERIG